MYIDIFYEVNKSRNQDRLDEARNLRVARLADDHNSLARKALLALAGGLIATGTRLQSAVQDSRNLQTKPC